MASDAPVTQVADETRIQHVWLRVLRRTGREVADPATGKSKRALEPGLWHIEYRPDGKPFALSQTLCGKQLGKFRPQKVTEGSPLSGETCQECLRRGYPGGGKPITPRPYQRRK